ncbi:MAG: DinB family protein [Gemmatimonadaceae bacterium]|nr:DinB family protein [Gemmatimonadaceae bacterium]
MTDFRSTRPGPDEYPDSTAGYVGRVPDGDVLETLSRQIDETTALLRVLPESMGDHRYAPGKWTIRQVVGHLTDAERVFSYRAFRFSRGDATPLAAFDENTYVNAAPFTRVSLRDLIDELEHARRATLHLFRNLDEAAFARRGIANNAEVSVRALAFIIAGHENHHLNTMRTRYLAAPAAASGTG